MEIVDKAMSTPLEPYLLERALTEFADMEEDDRKDFTARAVTMIRILAEEENLEIADRAWMAVAVEWRLHALVSLKDEAAFRGYSKEQDEDGAAWIRTDMIALAATQPLVRIDDFTVTFDADDFFQKLLAGDSTAGNA